MNTGAHKDNTASSDFPKPNMALFTDAVLLATASALAYGATFAYEYGFAYVYEIPAQLITINITVLLIVAAAIFPIGLMLLNSAEIILVVYPRGPGPIAREIRPIIIVEAYLLLATLAGDLDWSFFIFTSILVVTLVLGSNLVPILTCRGKWSVFIERLRESQTIDTEHLPKTAMGQIVLRIGHSWFLALLALPMILSLVTLTAIGQAKRSIEYFVLADRSNMAVLRIYDQNFVIAEFDPCTKQLIGPVTIMQLDKERTVQIIRANIGPLVAKSKHGATPMPEGF